MTINFMGGKEQLVQKAPEFFNHRTPTKFTNNIEEAVKKEVRSYVDSHAPIPAIEEATKPTADKIAEAYRAAHNIQG